MFLKVLNNRFPRKAINKEIKRDGRNVQPKSEKQ
jgi:hypothetical protein